MINVLHISDKLSVGDATLHGVTRLFSWWIPRFDKGRFHVMAGSLRKKDRAAEYLEGLGITVFCLGRGKFDPRTLSDIIRLIKAEQIHILHLHGYGATTFGRIASRMTGIPCIVHEHMFDKGIPFYQKWADSLLSQKSDHAIAVSESVKEFLVQYRSLPSECVKVIYNGVPLNMFKGERSASRQTWSQKLTVPEHHKIVGIVGRLNQIKGHCYFLEAAEIILRRYKDVSFLIAGDGELLPDLKAQSQALGIADQVIFMGHCDDVPSLLQATDIKVISSLSEGVPMTLFEAMAAGCPVVSTRVGGLGEIVKENETGFLVPSKNGKELADKILLLLEDEDLRRAMGEASERLSEQYDIASTVQQFEDYYEAVLLG